MSGSLDFLCQLSTLLTFPVLAVAQFKVPTGILTFDIFKLTRIADILSRHGPDAWFRVAPFDLWLNLQFRLYSVNHKCGILLRENTTLLIFK